MVGAPPGDDSLKILQYKFEEHLQLVHPDEYASLARERRERT